MSFSNTMQILMERGGTALGGEVSQTARERHPDSQLWRYTGRRLRQMEEKGWVQVVEERSPHRRTWKVTTAGRKWAKENGIK